MESKVANIKSVHDKLIIKHDDFEQYGRRTNIRIEGIEYNRGESSEELKVKIHESLASVDRKVTDDMLERWHRSGKSYVDDSGRTVAQTIVRFRHWGTRHQAQMAKKVARERKVNFYIRNDLTSRRHALYKKAVELLPDQKGTFMFARGRDLKYSNLS